MQSAYPVSTPAPRKYGYSRRQRISGGDLRRIKGKTKRLRTQHLSADITASPLPHSRVAIVVGKYGHSIVDRNRLRRQLRELVRLNLLPVCTGTDIVLHALAQAYGVEFSVLASEIQTLAQKLELEVLDS